METKDRKMWKLTEFLSRHQIPRANWYYWQKLGKTPKTFKLGKRVMLLEVDANAWLDSLSAGGAK